MSSAKCPNCDLCNCTKGFCGGYKNCRIYPTHNYPSNAGHCVNVNSCGPNEGYSDCSLSRFAKLPYSRLKVQGKWKSYVRKMYEGKDCKFSASTSYNPQDVAKLYGWPTGITGQTFPIYLIELGGGYNAANITVLFQKWGLPVPTITDVSVDGAVNTYSNDPNGPSVEVDLDICVACGIYSYMTGQSADIRVVFAPNTDQGFVDALNKVAMAGNGICSISWGSAEDVSDTSYINSMDNAFQAGVKNGVTWTVAAGDNLANDGTNTPTADFPASSPWVVACGGTALISNGLTTIVSETVWNSDGGGTGGGFSKIEPRPNYQSGVNTTNFRAEPDVTGNAAPETGWNTTFGTIGGTSAVAPAYAGYFAACCVKTGKPLGLVNSALYLNEVTFRDIVSGGNDGYNAGPGYDEASGLGVATLQTFNALTGGTTTLPNPPPVNPNPPPVTNPTPTSPTLLDVENVVNTVCKGLESQLPLRYARLVELVRVSIITGLQQLFAAKGHWFK